MTHHSWNPEALRAMLHAYPPYVGAGILVGTHFGGSLYAMVDPHLMILLIQRLGPDHVVWDQEANIDFRQPGLGTVHATIRITDEEVEAIRSATADGDRHLPQWTLAILDEQDEVVATVLKTLYVRRKRDDAS